MTGWQSRWAHRRLPAWLHLLVLLGASLLAYGLLATTFGFFWDDWAFAWISRTYGSEGLSRYFSTNRPYWGLIYQVTTALLGQEPLHWQVFGVFWRWASAAALWGALRLLWSKHPEAAGWISLLFLLYPGFDQQPIAITYGHFFLVLTFYLISWIFTLLALRGGRRAWLFTAPALLFAFANLLTLDYFFLLELLRIPLIWLALAGKPDRLRLTLRHLIPYLVLFAGAAIWRAFFFPYQTQNYQPAVLDQLRANPGSALMALISTVADDLWQVVFGAWGRAFSLPEPAILGSRTTQVYIVVTILAIAGLLAWLLLHPRSTEHSHGWAIPAVGMGTIGLLVAGWPFWLTGLQIGLVYPNNRFTLPFILGVALFIGGLLGLIPARGWAKALLVAVTCGFAIGWHFQAANAYRRDTTTTANFLWQLSWRIPSLQPGTAVLTNDLPILFSSDNSLTAPLNWTFAPENRSQRMAYILYFPSIRLATGLNDMRPGVPIRQDYLAAAFEGSTDQVLVVVYEPPGCLRVLDPQVDTANPLLTPLLRELALASDPSVITFSGAHVPPPEVYPDEPVHGWCYHFQKADMARQQGYWEKVVSQADQAFSIDDYPNNPLERYPFIEGYAHTGAWEAALVQSELAGAVSPLVQPSLCALWQRIQLQTPDSSGKGAAMQTITRQWGCELPATP